MAAALCQCYRVWMPSAKKLAKFCHLVPYNSISPTQMYFPALQLKQLRYYSSRSRRGFLAGLLDNIKQELSKNKEMEENIKKFREEAKKLEESEALQHARKKFKSIESETMKTSEVFRKKFGSLSDTVKE
ncbi:PREDICTED: mitochondrial import inner membrane translocase subunit TIM44-like, partial [Nanorana parkeri]|uniref:mitochondrial import inner membrane translocase subunit TIM44-like n=1 Tax=Nanorana parkeri TaxID=125878 RepID=UPI00085431E5